jgi:hypothetical protein
LYNCKVLIQLFPLVLFVNSCGSQSLPGKGNPEKSSVQSIKTEETENMNMLGGASLNISRFPGVGQFTGPVIALKFPQFRRAIC